MRSKRINIFAFLAIFTALAGVFFLVYLIQTKSRNNIAGITETKVDETEVFRNADSVISTGITTQEETETLPEKYLLSVPFQSQAPFGDWSEPYENACEEASIVMTERYLNNQTLSKDQMKSEIDSAVSWQIDNWREHRDLDAKKTLELAENYFDLSGEIILKYSAEDIKKKISSGFPIIAPTAGRKLGNPNFRGAGPEYHMLVIIGYDDTQGIFITNDPGTRKGEKYVYKYQTVLDAVSGPSENMAKELLMLSKS